MTSIVSPLFQESSVPESRVVTITPEMAAKWLKRNSGNRALRQSHVARLAKALEAGEWKLTGDPIRFSDTGKLIDGQHRLHAIVLANMPLRSMVIQGLPDDIFDVIDGGVPRTRADAVQTRFQLPVQKSQLLSSTATFALQYVKGAYSFRGSPSRREVLEFLDANPDLAHAVEYVYDHVQREAPVAKSIIAAFFFFASRLDVEHAERFIARFAVGAVDGPNDNLLYLRTVCQNMRAARRPISKSEIFGRLIIVWNSERRGKPIKHATNIRMRAGEDFPRFI